MPLVGLLCAVEDRIEQFKGIACRLQATGMYGTEMYESVSRAISNRPVDSAARRDSGFSRDSRGQTCESHTPSQAGYLESRSSCFPP